MPLRVTIEMVPGGLEEKAYIMGQAVIENDGTGGKYLGNYRWHIQHKTRRSRRSGRVTNFQRRSKGAWSLLKLVLDDYFKEEGPCQSTQSN